MYGVQVSLQSDIESAERDASPCDSVTQPQAGVAFALAQSSRIHGWRKAVLIFSLCGLPFALSSCGGSIAVKGTSTGALTASPNTVTFGSVPIGQTASATVSLLNEGSAPVQIAQLNLSGQPFSFVGPSSLPVTIATGGTYSLNVQFIPSAAGTATGQLTVASASSTAGTPVITLSGTGTTGTGSAALSALYCSSGSMTGSGADACTVTLTAPAFGDGLAVNLSSSSSAVTLPSTVTVPANATSAGFNASVSSVASAQAVTMTASVGGVSKNFTLQLNAAILALSINATNVAFGNVVVNTPATQSVVLTSTGTLPVTISGATLAGAGFTLLGPAFPATLNPGQEASINIEFDPVAVGTATGQLSIASNSSINGTAVVGLSGTGTAPPQAVAVVITPASVSTPAGANQQFAASVTGTSNTAVSWTLSGAGCSGTACGTISSAGLYTAPATLPTIAAVTITATSAADSTKSATAVATIVASTGKTYYIAPAAGGGNDSNKGLSASTPWLTPYHALNCGDVILAASGTYVASNLQYTWRTVNCPAGNNVAWLKCAVFDTCKIPITTGDGVVINQNYWGVQGFEVDASGPSSGVCFVAYPNSGSIHHVVFANDIAVKCGGGGIAASNNGTYSVDYFSVVGNIVYGSSGGSSYCASGISVYEPVKSDSLPGTHIYVAGNLSYGNFDGNPCNGTAPTDGSGVILDTFDGSQGGLPAYDQQAVVANNLLIGNGGRGITLYENNAGSGPWAHIYALNNTLWNNDLDTNTDNDAFNCGELELNTVKNVAAYQNILFGAQATGCHNGTTTLHAITINLGDASDSVYDNVAYALSGSTTDLTSSPGFSYASSNILGANPEFTNPAVPSAPLCGSSSSVAACMATVFAGFSPAAKYQSFGKQPIQSGSVYDPLFPQWMCNVNLPAGLVTPGCLAAP